MSLVRTLRFHLQALVTLNAWLAPAGLRLNKGPEVGAAEMRHAACLTGQLRGGPLSATQLQERLFNPSGNIGFDVFFVGPLGKKPALSFSTLVRAHPTLKDWFFYNGNVSFGDETSMTADVLEDTLNLGPRHDFVASPQSAPIIHFKVSQLPRFHRCGSKGIECAGLVSFLMQSFQWRACLGLIQRHETDLGSEFQSILRLRDDYYMPHAMDWNALAQRMHSDNVAFAVDEFMEYGGRDAMIPIMKTFDYLLSPPSSELGDIWQVAKSLTSNVTWEEFPWPGGTPGEKGLSACLFRVSSHKDEAGAVNVTRTSKEYTIVCDRILKGVSTWSDRYNSYVGPGDDLVVKVAHEHNLMYDPDRCTACCAECANGNGNDFDRNTEPSSASFYD